MHQSSRLVYVGTKIPVEDDEALARLAEREDRSKASVIRRAIERELEREEQHESE